MARTLSSPVVHRLVLAGGLAVASMLTFPTAYVQAAISGFTGSARTARTAPAAKAGAKPIKIQIGDATQITRGVAVEASGVKEAELGKAALARLRVNWADFYPGWTIAFLPARSNLLGMTLTRQHRVEIYVRQDRPIDGLAHDLAHELGHVTDVLYNTDERRQQYLDLRGLPGTTPWWTCNECRDLQVGAGDFAETFAQVAAPTFKFYSELGAKPTPAVLRRVADEILPVGLLRADA